MMFLWSPNELIQDVKQKSRLNRFCSHFQCRCFPCFYLFSLLSRFVCVWAFEIINKNVWFVWCVQMVCMFFFAITWICRIYLHDRISFTHFAWMIEYFGQVKRKHKKNRWKTKQNKKRIEEKSKENN